MYVNTINSKYYVFTCEMSLTLINMVIDRRYKRNLMALSLTLINVVIDMIEYVKET